MFYICRSSLCACNYSRQFVQIVMTFEQTYPKKFELCVCMQLWKIIFVMYTKSSFSTLQHCALCYSKKLQPTLLPIITCTLVATCMTLGRLELSMKITLQHTLTFLATPEKLVFGLYTYIIWFLRSTTPPNLRLPQSFRELIEHHIPKRIPFLYAMGEWGSFICRFLYNTTFFVSDSKHLNLQMHVEPNTYKYIYNIYIYRVSYCDAIDISSGILWWKSDS